MLVLSRQSEESVMIGENVRVTVVAIRGNRVQLGISAPRSVPVHRREIYEAINRQKAPVRSSC